MKPRRWLSMLLALVMILSMIPASVFAAGGTDDENYQIVIGKNATEMQEYAAKELRKYLYQLTDKDVPVVTATEGMDLDNSFVVGTLETNPLVAAVADGLEKASKMGYTGHEGEQGYALRKVTDNNKETLYIAGTDDEGVLYGVYGLLDDYYGIGFYFSGDAIPENYTGPMMPTVDEAKAPRQYMRGVLPWTNFPQSATSYSTEDWMYVIDQMARMRMNFLNIHSYNGYQGYSDQPIHNEMYHNFEYNGILSRNWNATASTGHGWKMPGWDVNEYRFGATDLFDDYDFGTDSTLHNEGLDNAQVFEKGYNQFQQVIDYAHSRGVKIGLGIECNAIMSDYGVSPTEDGVAQKQVETIVENYPELDVLLLYLTEVFNNGTTYQDWQVNFQRMYETARENNPDMQIAVSGWGIKEDVAEWVASVTDDVIVAPISDYGSSFVDGAAVYGTDTEYWGGPWMERDFNSSEYFYPFNMEISHTMGAYAKTKDTMAGLFTLSWRLTDGVDAKMSYIAKAPWDYENRYTTEESIYREYARKCYGTAVEDDMTQLICYDEKTVIPTLFGECNPTPGFSNGDTSSSIDKADAMIARVDAAIDNEATSAGQDARLMKLRHRLVAARSYCALDWKFNNTNWEELQTDFEAISKAFASRVDDISSLGNNISWQNRFVQERYEAREASLRSSQNIKAPLNVVAKATTEGAVLTWEYEGVPNGGFNVYRGSELAGHVEGSERTFRDEYDGEAVYTVKAVKDGEEGEASIAQTVVAGTTNQSAPQPIVVSPPASVPAGQDMKVKVRLLDDNVYEELGATIYYRAMGSDDAFTALPMEHRTKATFTADVATSAFADTGIEYYISVSDSNGNSAVWPASAPNLCAACTVTSNTASVLRAPTEVTVENGRISWNGVGGDVFRYNIYRSTEPDFEPSSANYVTYVGKDTTTFLDLAGDFDGSPVREEAKYYRITALDRNLNESIPSVAIKVGESREQDVFGKILFVDADALSGSRVAADQTGSSTGKVVAYTSAGGYAKFTGMEFSDSVAVNTVSVRFANGYSTPGVLEVWLDAPNEAQGGTKIGSGSMPVTGVWTQFETVDILLDQAISGVHDIYFVYNVANYNLDWFQFGYADPDAEQDVTVTTNDMMAFRNRQSEMKETAPAVTGFGNEGDYILLGKGYRPDAMTMDGFAYGEKTHAVALPGHEGIQCVGYFGTQNCWFAAENMAEGQVWLAYERDTNEKSDPSGERKLSMYQNGGAEKVGEVSLPATGSDWWQEALRLVEYVDTGVKVNQGDTLKFNCDVACEYVNPVKLFVTQQFSAEKLEITYSSTADMQCGLYVDDVRVATVEFPNSNGETAVVSVLRNITDGQIKLALNADDLTANNGAKMSVERIVLCADADDTQKTVTVSVDVGEGGKVEPAGETVEVVYGEDQTFTFVPDAGYEVENVKINGLDYGALTQYTFERLTYPATLQVTFTPADSVQTYTVAVDSSVQKCLSVSATSAQAGQPVNVSLTNSDYRLVEGTLCYVTESASDVKVPIDENTLQFSMPAENVTVTAEFEYVGGGSSGGGSSSSSSYTITVTQAAGGKISPSTTSVKKGEDKTFTITANEGYKISDVLVDGKSVGAVSTYTFKNVTAKHTITAKFEKIEDVTNVGGFVDVKSDAWYAEAVQYVVDEGLMNGTSSDKFTPNGATTRGMIVTILYRQAGSPEVESDGATWWSDARVWAMANGVSDGTNMDKPITREQLATMLYRYAELTGKDVSKSTSLDSFKDGSKVSGYAVEALKWAAAEGIVTGKTGGVIDPQAGATRAETATMLMRFCEGNS